MGSSPQRLQVLDAISARRSGGDRVVGTTTTDEAYRPRREQVLIDVVGAKGEATVLADCHRVGDLALVVTGNSSF
jgi:hypothetical protein